MRRYFGKVILFVLASGNSRRIRQSLFCVSGLLEGRLMSQGNPKNATGGLTDAQFLDYLAEAGSLCQTVARGELAGYPLYIVPQSRLVDQFGRAERCYGYTTPSLDLYLFDHLEDWQGRGPCMVINDLAIDEDVAPDAHQELFLNHALHELAHILDRDKLFAEEPSDLVRLQFERLVLADATKSEPSAGPQLGHGLSFVRIAIHLVERANRAGYDIRHAGVCHSHRYGLLPVGYYVDSLQCELQRAPQCLRELKATKPPTSFTCLCKPDPQPIGENP